MGATNNIMEVIQDYQIAERICRLCNYRLAADNYLLSYRTNNDTNWTDFEPRTSRGWIRIEIELEHLDCPETETCEGCWRNCLTKQIKEFKESFYCPNCYQQIKKTNERTI